nr:hypothetical protein [Tanacetum cinerariifolium]
MSKALFFLSWRFKPVVVFNIIILLTCTRRLNGLIGEMNVACADRMTFVQELRSVVGESMPAKIAVFFEQRINKEGSRECQLADLVNEGREMPGQIEFDARSLPICDELRHTVNTTNWEPQFIYYCERSKLDDIRLARQINALCDTLTTVIGGRWPFITGLEVLSYKFVSGKMVEFMKDIQDNDVSNLMKLQILGRNFQLRAREKDLFIHKLKGNMDY